jgi:hypothetical protein
MPILRFVSLFIKIHKSSSGRDSLRCLRSEQTSSGFKKYKQQNPRDFSPQANYTDRATAACRRSLVQTFADRGIRL